MFFEDVGTGGGQYFQRSLLCSKSSPKIAKLVLLTSDSEKTVLRIQEYMISLIFLFGMSEDLCRNIFGKENLHKYV